MLVAMKVLPQPPVAELTVNTWAWVGTAGLVGKGITPGWALGVTPSSRRLPMSRARSRAITRSSWSKGRRRISSAPAWTISRRLASGRSVKASTMEVAGQSS